MSDGHPSHGLRAEPNLTPLLDLVLQLLMFFMICANFVTAQVNENVQLPVMQSARPLEQSDRDADVLYLNLRANGSLEVVGLPPLAEPRQWEEYLRREFRNAERHGDGQGEVRTKVIIRADRAAPYRDVFRVFDACKRVGYRSYEIRARTPSRSAAR